MTMIDLHTHTNASDGSCTPSELLGAARQIGLKALAITDHDTFAGFDAALPLADEFCVELICGVELSTLYRTDEGLELPMHVLAYFPGSRPGDDFRAWMNSISATRRTRNLQLMERLQASNIDVSWEDFPGLGPNCAARPHFAKVLVSKGYVSDFQHAFDIYLSDPVLTGIRRDLPATQETVHRIRGNSGIASLAHPGRLYACQSGTLRAVVNELATSGLNAIEVYHSDNASETTVALLQMAEEFDLLATGGSDYHGENKPEIQLGTGRKGNLRVPDDVLENLKSSLGGLQKQRLGLS